ncbi:MAG: TrkH family potassium uptake protein [Planctomycetota bacterium]|nr:TrkH family potassium uptake protein [Planctomycetota bacterium]
MNYRVVSYFLSIVCFFVAAAMSFCCLFAIPWLGHRTNEDYSTSSFESDGVRGLLCSVVVSLLVGFLLRHWAKGERHEALYRKEAMATVGLSWVIVTVLGGMPYMIAGVKYAPSIRLESQHYAKVYEHKYHWRQNWESYQLILSDQQYQILDAVINAPELPSVGITLGELTEITQLSLGEVQQALGSLQRMAGISSKLFIDGSFSETSTRVRVEWITMGIGDSMFESQSGFSTTGATVISKLEDPGFVPHCILLWRSTTHFLGGLGIIVLFVVLLGGSSAGKALMRAEMPGPTKEGNTPRMQHAAWRFGGLYIALNTILTILLLFEMNLFDALCHAFGTMATGGFSTYDSSVGAFQSAYVDYTITFFMVLAGTNFALLYLLVILRAGNETRLRRWKNQVQLVLKDTELRVYLSIITVVTLLVMFYGLSFGDWNFPGDTADISIFERLSRAFRYGLFQVVAIITTTGFGTHDFNDWNQFGRALLLGLMFIGGCAGSTGGGMKVIRHILFVKILRQEVEHLYHPKVVMPLKLSGETFGDKEMRRGILAYFGFIAILFMLTWLLLMAVEPDTTWHQNDLSNKLIDNSSAVIATLNNIGPGLGLVGATSNYGAYSPFSKLVFTWLMMLGRLEIFSILILFSPGFWLSRR